ncbi:MAG: hypothetical protein AB1705_21435 [Verrucomicrobiota bacterium]
MRYLALIILLCLAGAASVRAQIKVEIVLDRKQFVPGESLVVGARIINHSGQPLKFGRDPGWLQINVEPTDNSVVQRLAPVPAVGEFELESAMMGTRRIDLAPCFDLSKPGRYHVTATVLVAEWNQQITSEPKAIEIFPGTTVWEQKFGVPNADRPDSPEFRKYALLKANHTDQKKYYVQVTDEYGVKTYGVFPVAPVIASREPLVLLDRRSNLHLLAPTGRISYGYYVISPSGNLILRERHDIAGNSFPRLRPAKDGEVNVVGGARKESPDDFPPPPTAKLEPPLEKPRP